MGAKGLKAIVVAPASKSQKPIADPEGFKTAVKAFSEAVRQAPFSGEVLPQLGTAALMGAVNNMGAFPCYNATQGRMAGWEKIGGEALAERIARRGGQTRHKGCAQCIIDCSNQYMDEGGNYLTGSLEYETLWSMGGMTGIDDLDTIARLDHLCDDIGLDTMSTGVALSVAMDAGHCGFGDGPAALAMVEEIAAGTELGRLLGNGPDAVGVHFNHPRVPTVKGQSIAGYDPRGMQGMAVTYATSPMGADHTAGNLIGAYSAGVLDPLKKEGQLAASLAAQTAVAALDATGLCLFTVAAVSSPEGNRALMSALGALTGRDTGPQEFETMGKTILEREKAFNRGAGLTAADDRLPRFFHEEPLPPHGVSVGFDDEELQGAV
jgi:aldehyde:ferredoxin oxidoreductase